MGEKRTKPNNLNISERQRYLIRREKKCDCLCPLSGRAGGELEELVRSRFMLVSSFSCHKHQERAEQGMEVPVAVVCPALCWPCGSSW